MRNVLYRALGQIEDTESDLYSRSLAEGDRLILCSDGLTRHVAPAEIADIAMHHNEPEEIAQKLIDLANQRGGEDNISVVVIVLESAKDIPAEEPPDPVALEDTEIGLHQAPLSEEREPSDDTDELPSVTPVKPDKKPKR
jgi:serine/threonine protein phosphatase PrpC